MDTGIKGKATLTVSEKDTAIAHGSGTLKVLATPALVALMERTAWESIADQLEPGQTTVGTAMDMQHTAPTPIGMTVTCESELVAIDRRALTFKLTAYDDRGPVGTATHGRFIVDAEKFQGKADSKKQAE
ncbi:MAG: thioesterase family protein [Eggerthellaceae bacterium]